MLGPCFKPIGRGPLSKRDASNNRTLLYRIKQACLLHPQPEERLHLRANGEMAPVRRKLRDFHAAPAAAKELGRLRGNVFPPTHFIGTPAHASKDIEQWLQLRTNPGCCELKVSISSGKFAFSQIVRVTSAPTPHTFLCLDRSAELSRRRPDRLGFKKTCAR